MSAAKNKIGLALGGGGARGIAHLGVLKILQQEGIGIDMIAGVSMGSLVGACFALGLDLEKLEKEIVSMSKAQAIRKFVDLPRPGKSMIRGEKIFRYINHLFNDADFSDIKMPFRVIATNLFTGEEAIISHGNIARAVQASICVPGIFPPVKIGHEYFIDGAVVNPTPINCVEKMGADYVIAVDLVMKKNIKLENPGMITSLLQSYEIIRTRAVKYNLAKVNGNVTIIKPEMRALKDSFKFYNMHKFIESGERAAKEALPEINRRLEKINE